VRSDEVVGVVRLLPRADLDRDRETGLRGLQLEVRDDEQRLSCRQDDQEREPLERHRPVAGQVLEIRPDRDQGSVEPVPPELCREGVDPIGDRHKAVVA